LELQWNLLRMTCITAAAEAKDEEEDDDDLEAATVTWLKRIPDEYEQMEVDFASEEEEEEEEMSGANLSSPDVSSLVQPPTPLAEHQAVSFPILSEPGRGKEEASGVGSFSLVQLPLPILSESGKGEETKAKTEMGIRTETRDGNSYIYQGQGERSA